MGPDPFAFCSRTEGSQSSPLQKTSVPAKKLLAKVFRSCIVTVRFKNGT